MELRTAARAAASAAAAWNPSTVAPSRATLWVTLLPLGASGALSASRGRLGLDNHPGGQTVSGAIDDAFAMYFSMF